jgi:hypothetical protein
MNASNYLIISILILLAASSCDKNNGETADKPNVEQFIALLKSGKYDSPGLPEFSHEDIPALLQYRDEEFILTKFPHNPVSSYFMLECKLGMFVLWTIESIRVVSTNSRDLIMNYPSQNPILALRHSDELQMVMDESSHHIAAEAYFDWWENNKNKDFNSFNTIDPLQDTEYRWK